MCLGLIVQDLEPEQDEAAVDEPSHSAADEPFVGTAVLHTAQKAAGEAGGSSIASRLSPGYRDMQAAAIHLGCEIGSSVVAHRRGERFARDVPLVGPDGGEQLLVA